MVAKTSESNNTAILCVYYADDSTKWIVDLQLKCIELYSASYNYTIYACITKGDEEVVHKLQSQDHLVLLRAESESKNPSKQHGDSLTLLFEAAKQRGHDIIITLDMDSFPINSNWLTVMRQQATSCDGVSAVHRVENNDKFLPHPSGAAFSKQFFDNVDFTFYPSEALLASDEFIQFLSQTKQRLDTGAGLAFELWKNNLSWHQIIRSNKQDLHYLIAGVYGDIIFHLGATSRAPVFHKELADSKLLSKTRFLRKIPFLYRIHDCLVNHITNKKIVNNRDLLEKIKPQLINDHKEFIKTIIS